MSRRFRFALALTVCAGILAACSNQTTAPTTGPPASSLIVTAVSPVRGPTHAGIVLLITGVGFQTGVTVTIGGVPTPAALLSSGTLKVVTPAHAAGVVDIVVTNPNGDIRGLPGGFTFESVAITGLSPNTGTTDGRTLVVAAGAWIQPGAIFTLGVDAPAIPLNSNSAALYTPPHTPGPVDVVIRNPDGESFTLTGGFTYVSPASFNFNGTWDAQAYATPASEIAAYSFTFTIQNNVVTQFGCGSGPIAVAPTALTTNRSFELSSNGVSLTGAMADVAFANGAMSVPACGPATYWEASKR